MESATLVEGVGDEVLVALGGIVTLVLAITVQWAFFQTPEAITRTVRTGPSSGGAVIQQSTTTTDTAGRNVTPGAVSTGASLTSPNDAVQPQQPSKQDGEQLEQEQQQQQQQQAEATPETIPEDTPKIQIRLKYLNDTERNVECSLSTKVGTFKDQFFPEERREGKVIRLISCGKLLNDESLSLQHFGVAEGNTVLHVQISNPPQATLGQTQQQAASAISPTVSRLEANIASLAYLVLGAMLVLFWYVHFQYRDLFTNSATTALVGISGLFCVFVFAPTQPMYFHAVAQHLAPEL